LIDILYGHPPQGTLEVIERAPVGADVRVQLNGLDSENRAWAEMWIEEQAEQRPLRLNRIFFFQQVVDQSGIWTFKVLCNGEPIGEIAFLVKVPDQT
jgi:hypothetical protein